MLNLSNFINILILSILIFPIDSVKALSILKEGFDAPKMPKGWEYSGGVWWTGGHANTEEKQLPGRILLKYLNIKNNQ